MYIPHSYIINNICKLNISQQKRILGLLWIKSIFQDKFLYIIYRYSNALLIASTSASTDAVTISVSTPSP